MRYILQVAFLNRENDDKRLVLGVSNSRTVSKNYEEPRHSAWAIVHLCSSAISARTECMRPQTPHGKPLASGSSDLHIVKPATGKYAKSSDGNTLKLPTTSLNAEIQQSWDGLGFLCPILNIGIYRLIVLWIITRIITTIVVLIHRGNT